MFEGTTKVGFMKFLLMFLQELKGRVTYVKMQLIAEATRVHIKHHIFVQKEKEMLLIQVAAHRVN